MYSVHPARIHLAGWVVWFCYSQIDGNWMESVVHVERSHVIAGGDPVSRS